MFKLHLAGFFLLALICAACAPSSSDSGGGAGGIVGPQGFRFEPSSLTAAPGDTVSFTVVDGVAPYQFGYVSDTDIQSYSDPTQIQATFDSDTGAGTYTIGPNDDCTDRLAAQDSTGAVCYLTVTVSSSGGGGGGGGTGSGSGGSGGQTGLYSVSISGRSTTVYCPTNYNGTQTWPVIVNLPGLGDTGYNAARKWLPGESPYPAEGYIIVGCQLQTWPMEPDNVPTTADYQYVLACIDYVRSKYNVDLGKTLLVGFSRGATMAFYFVHDATKVNAVCTMDGKFCSNVPLDSTPKIPFYVMGSGMYMGQVSTAQAYLTQNGYDVTTRTFPELGHGWVIDENPAILSWFQSKTN